MKLAQRLPDPSRSVIALRNDEMRDAFFKKKQNEGISQAFELWCRFKKAKELIRHAEVAAFILTWKVKYLVWFS